MHAIALQYAVCFVESDQHRAQTLEKKTSNKQTHIHTHKKNTLVGGFRVDNVDIYMVVMEKIINLAQMSSLAIAPGIWTRKRRKQIRPVAFRPRVRAQEHASAQFIQPK